jgi:hypothetical protein
VRRLAPRPAPPEAFAVAAHTRRGAPLLGLAILAGALARPARAADPPLGVPFVVTQALVGRRLRVFGQPGDLALRNRSVTLIVRRSDGWLVDFWTNRPTRPTAPQLEALTNIDGLWVFHPLLWNGNKPTVLKASSVRASGDAIETESDLSLGAGKVRVVTDYRLDGDTPRVLVETRVEHTGGGELTSVGVGDALKWGNVDYFLSGVGRAPHHFFGHARWIGRKGACGDLMLRTLETARMRITYAANDVGIAPEIRTVYAYRNVAAGAGAVFRRALEYAPIVERATRVAPSGTLEVRVVDEAGRPLAAKLTFTGVDGTPNPDFGNDGDLDGAGRFAWSGRGEFSRTLPAGHYHVLATAGFQRAAQSWDVDVAAGKTLQLSGRLPRVIDTPGWISADFHLHAAPSVDADIACSARVIAAAAEGVELAVSTDHYVVTDLGPTVRALRRSGALASPLMTMVGSEVSTVGNLFGHFNVFPLKPGAHIGYVNTTPRRLFTDARAASPRGILQVNHPRFPHIGYFLRYQLDPKTGRVPRRYQGEYDADYDTIEVFNGSEATLPGRTRLVLFDWIHLLGLGHHYTGTGGSDSHKLFFLDPGLPRNLIHYGQAKTDADDLHADPQAIIEAIRQGHVVVTSGPILDADVDGVGPGGTVSGHGKHLALHLRVRAAPWIDVRDVQVLEGGRGARIRWISVPRSEQVVRLDTTVPLFVPAKTFVIVLARGHDDLPNVYTAGIKPFAFTNPIWLEP